MATGDSTSVRGLRVVFQITPAKLKELEEGWRARRRRALSDITERVNVIGPQLAPASQSRKPLTHGIDGEHGHVRLRRRPTSHPPASPAHPVEESKKKPAGEQGKIAIISQQAATKGSKPPKSYRSSTPAHPHVCPAPGPSYPRPRPASPPRTSRGMPRDSTHIPETQSAAEATTKSRKSSRKTKRHDDPSATESPSASPLTQADPTTSDLDNQSPQPIIAFPLPPTPAWTPTDRHATTLIRVEGAPSKYEIRLKMGDGERIDVWRSGAVMQIRPQPHDPDHRTPTSDAKGTADTQQIRLSERQRWTKADYEKWEEVRGIVEEVKRRTPHVKIFHALGQLVITCSDDIVLSIDFHTRHDVDITRDDPIRADFKPSRRSCCSRVTFSPSRSELRIELSTDEHGRLEKAEERQDSFRSRRIVRPIALASRCINSPGSNIHGCYPLGGKDRSHIACFGLVMDAWLPEERDAVYRLCALREEWELYTKSR